MKTGMLWYYGSSDKKKEYDISKEIQLAFGYFYKKYGYYADVCLINPSVKGVDYILDVDDGHKVTVSRDRFCMNKHLIIGTEQDYDLKQSKATS